MTYLEDERKEEALELKLSLTFNGQDETINQIPFHLLLPPRISNIYPQRGVEGVSTEVTFSGSHFTSNRYNGTHQGLICRFDNMFEVEATIYSDSLASCEAPAALPIRHEVQKVIIEGDAAVSEVQGLSILAPEPSYEVQRLRLSTEGQRNEVREVSVKVDLSLDQTLFDTSASIHSIKMQVDNEREIQRWILTTEPYKEEKQSITIRVEDDVANNPLIGYIRLKHQGVVTLPFHWNASVDEWEDTIQSTFNLQDVRVEKEEITNISTSYLLTFSIHDTHATLIEADPTYSTRLGLDIRTESSYRVKGRSAEIQEIMVDFASDGFFSLSFASYHTSLLPFNSSAEHVERELETLPPLHDVSVSSINTETSSFGWLVTFLSIGGSLELLKAQDASSLLAIDSTRTNARIPSIRIVKVEDGDAKGDLSGLVQVEMEMLKVTFQV
jgi:hypothetical protein